MEEESQMQSFRQTSGLVRFRHIMPAALVCLVFMFAHDARPQSPAGIYSGTSVRLKIGFWNVRNLFDTADDPHKADNDFTPGGSERWTQEKLNAKLRDLSRVIIELNSDILGLAEIENMEVLRMLGEKTGYPYRYLIERDDARGIDVAILSRVELDDVRSFGSLRGYLTGSFRGLNIAFVHWKSKRGDAKRTAAMRLKQADESLELNAPFFLLGDFNERPQEDARLFLQRRSRDLMEGPCASFYEGRLAECIDGIYYSAPEKAQINSEACSITILEPGKVVRIDFMSRNVRNSLRPLPEFSDHFPVQISVALNCPGGEH